MSGTDAVDMVMAIAWYIDADPPSSFACRTRELWKANVNWSTAMSYNVAQAMIEALAGNANTSVQFVEGYFGQNK